MTDAVAARSTRSVVQRMAALTVTVVVMVVALALTAIVGIRSVHNGISRRTTEVVPVLVAIDRVDTQLDRLRALLTAERLDREAAQQVTAALDEARRAGQEAVMLDAGEAVARQTATLDALATALGPALPSGGELPGDADRALDDARVATVDARVAVTEALLDDMRASRSQSWRFLVGAVVLAALAIVVVTWNMRATALAIANPLRALRDRILRARDDVARQAAADEAPSEPSAPSSVREVQDLADQFDRLSQDGAAWLRREQQSAEQRRVLLDIAAVTRQSGAGPVDLDRVCELLAGALHADRSGLVATIEGRTWSSWWQDTDGDAQVVDWLTERLLPEPVESMRFLFDGPTRIDDLAAHPVAAANDFDTATAGVRAILTSPVVAGQRTIGVLGVTMRDPRAWSDDDASLVKLVADQVAQVVVERQYIESLQDLDRQKSEFLANASHELRTPLTSIAGYLELLSDGDFGPLTAEQERAHDVIARNTARLRDLIEDILVLSRIEGDRLRPDLRPLDLRDVIERVRGDLAPVADRKGLSLAVTGTEIDTAQVLGDREQLERALTNVVANAVKFTPPGGAVTVGLAVAAATATVTCRDTGIGIPAADLPLTGTKFFRARNAAEHVIPGTGIGLTIVRSILTAHGGQMKIDSVEGEGTTVELSLPVSDR